MTTKTTRATASPTPKQAAPAADTKPQVSTRPPRMADPFLALAADILDDLERQEIATENRHRALTRDVADSDGEIRGYGLDERHPDVARLAALKAALGELKHQAVLDLQRKMRKHPLGPWAKAQRGLGERQIARLLAAIGDPYWNELHDRPRTVSELWAYCGYHTLSVGQVASDTQHTSADGDEVRVAARRRKGTKANWSNVAKMRAFNVAESCVKAGGPYREAYDKRKANTEGRVHDTPCAPCGKVGKPALPGTEWRPGHRHADALRITAKTVLRDLWRESKRLHDEQAVAE